MRDYNFELMAGCVDGNLRAVEYALANGADINTTDPQGHTPLMFAIKNDRHIIIDYLLFKGADTNMIAQDGFTA